MYAQSEISWPAFRVIDGNTKLYAYQLIIIIIIIINSSSSSSSKLISTTNRSAIID